MNTTAQKHKTATSLRFRRWSRKGYAAFVSRQCVVTIGQLSGNVCERLRRKTENTLDLSVCFSSAKKDIDNEELWDSSLNLAVSPSLFVSQNSVALSTSNGPFPSLGRDSISFLKLSVNKTGA